MASAFLLTTTHLPFTSVPDKPYKFPQYYIPCSRPRLQIFCSSPGPELALATGRLGNDAFLTGGAYDFSKSTTSLTEKLLSSPKQVTLVRHGLSTWNDESRVQGSSNLSVLTETGIMQAERCKKALVDMHFDKCFSSPISRAKSTAEVLWSGREEPLIFLDFDSMQSTAEVLWSGREEPLIFLDSLKEAHLFHLEGMKNVDAKRIYPKDYMTWRQDPSKFNVNGVYPLQQVWETASAAWKEILFTPGEDFLVVTHKSILRALICTALGLSPERFRAFDVNNGGISVFKFNVKGEAMLQSLNMTAHMYTDHTYHY